MTKKRLMVSVPSAPACTASLSTGSVIALLSTGAVPADSALGWPLVVLALGCMAYDLGFRALERR
ncbi:hypothetical protein OHA91_39530 (plasmid) [Streptomyces erythrochromogenes]|uniref:Uncharacterized protein n=1 Tax=Streptomyces erythrochromogenes TaxID=285574 RepID=A0ABZ1QP93_9ACTN|nr:hypothetical protein [Streptomyces erythrochromogenes]